MTGTPAQHSRALTWTLSILGALLLYVLSLGPVIYLCAKEIIPPRSQEWVLAFYYPLMFLGDRPPLKTPLKAYVDWWLILAYPPPATPL